MGVLDISVLLMKNVFSNRAHALSIAGALLLSAQIVAAQPGGDRGTRIQPGESCPTGTTEIRPRN